MYLIMTEGELQVEVNNQRIRVNSGEWFDIPPQMRYGTIEVSFGKIYMWRGYVKYEYNWEENTYNPASRLDKFLSLFYFNL